MTNAFPNQVPAAGKPFPGARGVGGMPSIRQPMTGQPVPGQALANQPAPQPVMQPPGADGVSAQQMGQTVD